MNDEEYRRKMRTRHGECVADLVHCRVVRYEAQAAIERVRALHSVDPEYPLGYPAQVCTGCDHLWPCPTVRALDAPSETAEEG